MAAQPTARAPRSGIVRHAEQPASVRRRNLSATLGALFVHGAQSRAQLARRLAVSAPSSAALARALLQTGLATELPHVVGGTGRPARPIAIDSEHALVRGVHIGVRTTGLALMTLDGRTLDLSLVRHADLTPAAALRRIVTAARRAAPEDGRVLCTAVVIGGRVDSVAGRLVEHPEMGWADVDLGTTVARALGGPVVIDQTTRAAAAGELLLGEGRDVDSLVVFVVTSNVGAAVVSGRVIQHGEQMRAGDVTHLPVATPGERDVPRCPCGRRGCFGVVASDETLLRQARDLGHPVTRIRQLVDLAGQRRRIDRLLARRDAYVGRAAALLAGFIDPAKVVVLGSPARFPRHLDVLHEQFATYAPGAARPPLTAPDRGVHLLTLAAGAVAIDTVIADPMSFGGRPTPRVVPRS